jgi:hypothetical protein
MLHSRWSRDAFPPAQRIEIVAKKKASVPLFELMSRSRLGVGEGDKEETHSQNQKETPGPGEQATETPKQAVKIGPARRAEEPAKPPAARAAAVPTPAAPTARAPKAAPATFAPPAGEPILQTGNGRLRISLNYVSSLVLVGGILLLLAGTFVLGRKTAPGGPTETVSAGTGEVRTVYHRYPDRLYLVLARVQGATGAARQQAEQVAAFFADNGLPASLIEHEGNWLVWSLKPFGARRSYESQQFAERVRSVSARYSGSGVEFLPAKSGELWFARPPQQQEVTR